VVSKIIVGDTVFAIVGIVLPAVSFVFFVIFFAALRLVVRSLVVVPDDNDDNCECVLDMGTLTTTLVRIVYRLNPMVKLLW